MGLFHLLILVKKDLLQETGKIIRGKNTAKAIGLPLSTAISGGKKNPLKLFGGISKWFVKKLHQLIQPTL